MHYIYAGVPPVIDRIYPVYVEDSPCFFGDFKGRPVTRSENDRGGNVITAPLRFEKRFDLLGMSMRQKLADINVINPTTVIDPALRIEEVYFSIDGELFAIDVSAEHDAVGIASLLSDTRKVNINYISHWVDVYVHVKTFFKEDPKFQDELVKSQTGITFKFRIIGEIQTSTGITELKAEVIEHHGVLKEIKFEGFVLKANYFNK